MADTARVKKPNNYSQLIEAIFQAHHQPGLREMPFERDEIANTAATLGVRLPKNLGDVIYSFRYRNALPQSIADTAPEGEWWVIRLAGRGRYCFALVQQVELLPSASMSEIKVPDATPGLIELYAQTDEQALLAKLRYNRLIDVFTGVTCYSLQSHLRTQIAGMGQAEVDELYIGVDERGVHYVLPVQAKGAREQLGVIQVEQDIALCAERFPDLVCRPIGAQFMLDDLIALFELVHTEKGVRVSRECHYRLVSPDQLTPDDLAEYRRSLR